MQKLPSHTLWTWQRSENLSAIDPATTAIAYLDQTVRIGSSVERVPRTQGFAYPTKAVLIHVVRIEVLRDAKLDRAVLDEVVEAILRSAGARSAALQIDFDATRSQQEFYRRLLVLLRRRMPPALPLSMTALVSWCSYDDWLGGLPVDEAVPMFFRMGPDRTRAADLRVTEPVCGGSVGVSTREPWPADLQGKRVYVFADGGWRQDMPLLEGRLK